MSARVLLLLIGASVVALALHLLVGSGLFSLEQVISGLRAGPPSSTSAPEQVVVWSLRLPRALGAFVTGAALATSGAALQALFRNPLAEPYILGISSGAAVGGVLSALTGFEAVTGIHGTFLMAFAAAVACMSIVLAFARTRFGISVQTVLIVGVTLGTFLWAVVTLLLTLQGADANRILFWLLGSFAGADWQRVATVAGAFVFGFGILCFFAKPLTLFSTGEETASSLGVEVERLKWAVLLTASGVAAAAVSAFGIIGFVGLFVPNLARRVAGISLSGSLPGSAFLGGIAIVLADLLAQRMIPGREINVGVLTALMAAPFLIVLARRKSL